MKAVPSLLTLLLIAATTNLPQPYTTDWGRLLRDSSPASSANHSLRPAENQKAQNGPESTPAATGKDSGGSENTKGAPPAARH